MPSRIVNTIKDIANAIRAKTETTDKIKGKDIPEAIRNIVAAPRYLAGMYYNEFDSSGNATKVTMFGKILKDKFLPSTVTEIFLDGVKKIPDNFLDSRFVTSNCTTIHLSENLTDIGAYAFYSSKVTTLKLPDGSINKLPESVTVISNYCFANSKFKNIEWNDGITRIGDYAFDGYSGGIKNTSLPASLEYIGAQALLSQQIPFKEIPAGVKTIGSWALGRNTVITELTFKGTPTSLSNQAFSGCTSLKTINVPWAEGAIPYAPWGATNATVNYNYTGG